MTAPALLRQLAQPAQDAYQNTVTVTVPTRLLTALADELEAAETCAAFVSAGVRNLRVPLAEVERAAKEHTSQ